MEKNTAKIGGKKVGNWRKIKEKTCQKCRKKLSKLRETKLPKNRKKMMKKRKFSCKNCEKLKKKN